MYEADYTNMPELSKISTLLNKGWGLKDEGIRISVLNLLLKYVQFSKRK
jgi:hypothetical protein